MRLIRRFWWVIPVVIVMALAGFVVWANATNPIEAEAESAMRSDALVTVSDERWLTFTPIESEPTTGLIFYPGGKVDARAYAPLAHAAAQAGTLAVIVPMPLNLAVFDMNAANAVIAAYPNIEHWVIGGHSLGGSMAARYVLDNPNQVDGLALIASYSDRDISTVDVNVTVIYGSLDGLAQVETVEGGANFLPADTTWVKIEGGNHAQFGWYGDQDRDNAATISHEAQYDQLIAAVIALLESVS